MATDSTIVPQTSTTNNDQTDLNLEVVQLAQADGATGATGVPQTDVPGVPNGSVNVAFPEGQNIVRVQVAPGETISIPFDGDLAAKFGEEGNLAIKVGDRTIILQGYAEANQETGVTLKDESGDDIDVASVIAATDPNLDIQTAAGGTAGGSTGGSGFFSPFSNAGSLGGLGELGVLGQTELQYGLIQPDSKILIQQPEAAAVPPSIIGITPVQAINEDDLGHDEREVPELAFAKEPFGGYGPRWGNDIFDNEDLDNGGNLPDFSPEPTSVIAQITVNPGSSPNLSLTFNAATAAALDAMHLFSENLPLHYVISDDGKTLTAFIVTGNESTVDVFTLQANDGVANPDGTITFDVTTTLLYSLDNDGKQTEGAGDSNPNTFVDDISLHIPFTVTGSSGSASGAYDIVLRDDTPDMDPFGNTETAFFDTFAPVSEGDLPATRYGSFDFSYGADGEATEGDKFKQQDNVLEGPNATFVLNVIDPEAGEGHSYLSIDTKSIATPGDWTSSATELKSGDASVTVWAYRDGDITIIEGRISGDPSVDDSSTGLVFKIEINNHYGYYSAELFGPLSHPDSDQTGASDPLQFDLTATITDGDGDQKSGTQSFQLLDDGPSIEAAGVVPSLTVDESNLAQNDSTSFAGVFTALAGADGQQGSIAYALGVSAAGADSGLVDTATGNHVFLFLVNGQVVGKEGSDAATAETSGNIVFTLSVTSGVLTLDQQRPIIHPDSANPDEPTTLSAGDLVTLTATVTDNDNDTASTTINIGDKLTFKDDGPAASNDAGGSIAEGSGEHVIGNAETLLLANDLPGADGYKPNSLTILGSGSLGGTLSIDGSGNLIYTPPAHVANPNGAPVTESFTYQYLDRDDDPATAQISFQITDTGPGIDDVQVRAIVDEDALGGNPGGTKDYVGGANNSPDEAHWNGHILFNYGNDGVGDIALSTDSDTGIRKLDGTVIQTSWDAASHTLTGYGADLNDVVFTIHITDIATGAYTLSLLQPIRHRGTGEDEDNRNVTINVTVTDSDNSVATGSFTITIDDDTPIANNDTGGIYEEGSGAHIIGNAETVLIANDLPGADGYRAGSLTIIGSGSLGGSLVIDGTGNLIYTPPAHLNSSANVTETFTYQYTDRDGDPATAQISFEVSDGAPTVDRVQAIATVDEDPLGGNAGGDGDYAGGPDNSPDEAHWNGQIHFSYGNDGPGDIALSTAGNQTGLTKLDGTPIQTSWDAASHTLTGYGSDANDVVFTIHITDIATGAYTLTLNQPVAHGTAGTEDDLSFTVDITVTDSDNSVATGSFQVTIDDDTPVITAGGSLPGLTVDESNLAQNDSTSFAGVFTALAGADGQQGNIAYALGVSTPGADSGLVDTATGNHVFLFLVNGQVVGKEGSNALDAATGSTVFTLSVDGSGTVTLDQVRAIINPVPGANHDEPATLSAANLVTLTATVTDGDNDTASATAGIGTTLVFKDDGPSITANGVVPSLTVDESNLAQNDSTSFAGVFTALAGADGQQGSIAYALGVSAPGADSGLVDTATGNHVFLFLVNGQVVGKEGSDALDAATGSTVFTLSVDGSGTVSLDQVRAIINPTGGTSHDEPATLSAANLVTLTATITDGDHDTASATAGIGTKLVFKDDGPSITANGVVPSLTVDESNLAQNDSASFAGVFTALAGADGQQGSIAYALGVSAAGADSGLVDTATGNHVFLFLVNGQVVGKEGSDALDAATGSTVFTLSVDGSGTVSLDQQRAIINPVPGASHDEPATLSAANLVTLTATVTDKDNDTASATAGIGTTLVFKDDGPSITANGVVPSLTVDESNLAQNDSTSFAGVFTALAGADGQQGSIAYALGVSAPGADSGLVDTATGQAVLLSLEGNQVVGRAGVNGPVVFTLSVDGSGTVTLDQVRAIINPLPGASHDEPATLSAAGLVTLTATVTDDDHDTASATAGIGTTLVFKDDGPSITANGVVPSLTVDESNLAQNDSASFAGVFTALAGADGQQGSIAYALGVSTPGADSGLVDTATGNHVFLFLVNGQVVGKEGSNALDAATGSTVFTLSVDGSGTVALDQVRAIINPTGGTSHDEPATLSAANLVTLTATVTDGDNDTASATAGIGTKLVFKDDGLTAVADTGTANSGATINSNVEANDTFGADGKFGDGVVGVRLAGNDTTTPVLGGTGMSITGTFGTLILNADGSYSYQAKPNVSGVDHFVYTIKDGDGDLSTTVLDITVDKIGPATARGSTVVDEAALDLSQDGNDLAAGTVTGSNAISSGETNTGTLGLPAGVTVVAGGQQDQLGSFGILHVNTDGTFTYTLTKNDLNHSVQGTDTITAAETFTVTIKDSLGNTNTATITIDIKDDVPSIEVTGSLPSLTVDESNLAQNDSASFAGVFTALAGADGQQGNIAYALGVSAPGADSGLVDTATGQAVLLSLEGNQVVGRAGVNGPVVFTLSVDGSGTVTLDQVRAIINPLPGASHDEPATLSAANLVTLTATVTDKDNDTASATAGIGTKLVFKDDGPSITANGVVPSLTVDESNLAQNDSASFAGVFTALAGADGQQGSIAYALGVSAPGADSGLVDTATGQAVLLSLEGNQVVGRAGVNGPIVFTLSVDGSGTVTLDQVRAIINPVPGASHDEPATLSAAGLVTLTATVTDGDHDTASATANIGTKLVFKDDGPSITANGVVPSLTVDESNLAQNDSTSFAGVFTALAGADGQQGSIAYALGVSAPGADSGLVDTATGQAVLLSLEGNQVVGRAGVNGPVVFTLSVDGSGTVTLDQVRAIINPLPGASHDEPATLSAAGLVTLTATVTDDDHDTASATAGIGTTLVFKDDGPSITANGVVPSLTVDESNLAQNDSASFAGVFTALAGADGQQGSIAYALGVSTPGADSGLVDTATGNHVFLFLVNGQVVGKEGSNALDAATGSTVFTLSVDGSGTVALDQVRAIINPTGGTSHDEPATLSAANLVTLTATVTDGDNDTASATAGIGTKLVFKDDGLTASGDLGGSLETAGTVSKDAANGVLANDQFGADGAKSGGGVVGAAVGDTGTASTGNINGPLVGAFGTLTLNSDGSYSYTAKANVSGTDVFTYTIQDGDGDTATATLSFTVEDQAKGSLSGSGGAYEDGAPGQYQGDFDFNPTGGNPAPNLNLNFTGADNETVTSYTFNDVPVGVKLYDVSVPGSPVLLFTGDGSADFVASGALLAKMQAHQIVVVGPANSDADITLNVTAAITDPTSGLNGTVSTNVVVYVDAVADQPTNLQIIVADSSDSGSSFSLNEVGTLQVKANFADLDGSETHSVTVQLQSGFTASGFTGADLTAPGGTFNGVPYTYNVATGTVVFTVPNSVSDLDLTFHVKAPASGTLPDSLNFTATATATESTVSGGLGGGNADLTGNNTATVTAQTGIPATRILDGSIITNTSSGSQEMILSFIDTASPLDAFAQVFIRDAGGQQGAFLTDAGFNIDRTHDFSVVAENAVDGHAVLITDMTVEGVTVVGQGTVQLDHDASSNKPVAITDVISPDTGTDQKGGHIDSTDGNGSITDADATHHNYLYGGDNGDTITAGNGSDGDILNGGKSADTLTGGTGNDLLVYGVGDHIDGKDGFDILRIDQGALYNTGKFQGGWSVEPDIKDATVDLTGADIKNIESILITEEAKPDSSMGTTLKLNAQDVFNFTDEHHSLYIVGSQGDKLDFDQANWTNTGQVVTSDGGQQFVHYQATINAVTVNLYVDKDVQTQ